MMTQNLDDAPLDPATAECFLDAMEGVCYLVDLEGRLNAVGWRGWNSFAAENGAPQLSDLGSVLGRPLIDFIAGTEVRRSYLAFMEKLLSGRRRSLHFETGCDSPGVHRRMRMCISTVAAQDRVTGFLFQSLTLEEHERPPVDLFDKAAILSQIAERSHLPILRMCSYCQSVAREHEAADSVWVSAEAYYRLGGTSEVRISHGICSVCMTERVEPLLA